MHAGIGIIKMDRYICKNCKQELSRSASYRHKEFPVCPGKKSTLADGHTLKALAVHRASVLTTVVLKH